MKFIRIFLYVILTIYMPVDISYAAFTSLGKVQCDAGATTGGTPSVTVPFSVSLKNISNNAIAGSVTWPAITAGQTAWLSANQYIAVKGWATYSNWGIQVYTHNTNYTGTGSPAGLVNTVNTIFSLPMSWRTSTALIPAGNAKLSIIEKTVNGNQVLADGQGLAYYPWFFMLDKKQGTFGNYQEYSTFIGSKGYQHAPTDYATPAAADTTYYVYLGANFTMAVPGISYSTNSLTVEMYRL
jgi:hypothetical protein